MTSVTNSGALPANWSDVMNESSVTTETVAVVERSMFHYVFVQHIAPIIITLIVLVGVLGNSLVIYVIKTRPKLRTVTNMLLFNLALADLTFVLICPPFTAYMYATERWPLSGMVGRVLCKMMHYLLNVTVYVTIYTLVLISAVRFITVVYHQVAKEVATKRNVLLAILAIWVVMLLGNSYLLVFYDVDTFEASPMCDCSTDFGRVHFLLFFILAYLLPLVVIGVFSLCILAHIQTPSSSVAAQKRSSQQRKRRVSRMLVTVVVVFAVFWLPIHIHLIYSYWVEFSANNVYHAISIVWNCLAYFNSCVNPIIYNIASKEFRDSFREVVCCLQPSGAHTESQRRKSARTEEQTHLCGGRKTEVVMNGDEPRNCDVIMTGATTISAEDNETVAVTAL